MDLKTQAMLRAWAQDMADQKDSGLNKKDWCKVHGIPESTFGYRQRRVWNEFGKVADTLSGSDESLPVAVTSKPVFAKLSIQEERASNRGIEIRMGDVHISISDNASPCCIKAVLEAMCHA